MERNSQNASSLTKRLTVDAMLTALALGVYFLEAWLPPMVPIPGVRLGLTNIVTLFALYRLGPRDGALVLLCRILLATFFGGQAVSLLFSLCGGLLAFLSMLLIKPLLGPKQIWVCSIIGALAHNTGQLFAAWLILKQAAVFSYLPVLIISAILTGLFTGICAQELIHRLGKKS
ncbi:MAG: Gx transporter family protein [Lachnospiraceae bacterium]|nr:Gx transporter family protein [Lachnospiraceae bacterium]